MDGNGAGMAPEQLEAILKTQGSDGVGLPNIQKRLKMLYGTQLFIESRKHIYNIHRLFRTDFDCIYSVCNEHIFFSLVPEYGKEMLDKDVFNVEEILSSFDAADTERGMEYLQFADNGQGVTGKPTAACV